MVVVNDVELQEPALRPEDAHYRTPLKPNTRQTPHYRSRYYSEDDRSSDYDYDSSHIVTITPGARYGRPHPAVPLSDIVYPRRVEKEDEFTCLSALGTLVSLFSYIADFGTDLVICYFFYKGGHLWWLGLTAGVAALSAITVNIISLRWYMHDEKERATCPETARRPHFSATGWMFRILFHFIFLGPVIRYLDLLIYGIRSRRNGRSRSDPRDWHSRLPARIEQPDDVDYYLLMVHEDRDTALLSLLQSFMESAPQLVLQLYFLAQTDIPERHQLTEYLQLASVATSLFELAWALASYHRAIRRSSPDKRNMSRTGTALQFLWRYCTIGSRVVALALFASEYKYWLIPLCIGHWGVMSVWVMHQQTRFCDTDTGEPRPCHEYLFNMVIGAIYLFCFLNVKEEPTRRKYAAFYVIVFLEDASMIVLWYLKCDTHLWYRYPALGGVIGAFFLGIVFMLIYYRYFHPNGRMPLVNRAARCC
ncbi:XK-related protein 4-like [Centruroides vittatus]|uniref:XK-related protein 4-like n=1 Tax=Centruroides vittatus TaxID=120091 RepID=UPI00350F5DAC